MRIIQLLAIFVLPFLLYAAYFMAMRRRARQLGEDAPNWEDGPWYWLTLAGALLVIIAVIVINSLDPGEAQRLVTPPTLRD